MSKADQLFVRMCTDILDHGTTTEGQKVRPHWEDGTPAYTIKNFGVTARYDLREEFPALTLRRTALKSAMDEILWIYQRKSNNIHDLNSHIWDEWADESGSIGKAYGYQIAQKSHYPEGDFDQMDRVLYDLTHTPYSRRIMTNMYTFADLSEMHLYPCAYSVTYNVTHAAGDEKPTLNMVPGHPCGEQLERVPVRHLAHDGGAIRRHGCGRASARHRGRAHLRPARRYRAGAHCAAAVPRADGAPEPRGHELL